MSDERNLDVELGTNVYTAPAERLHLIYLAFVAASLTLLENPAFVAELVLPEFSDR